MSSSFEIQPDTRPAAFGSFVDGYLLICKSDQKTVLSIFIPSDPVDIDGIHFDAGYEQACQFGHRFIGGGQL